MKIDPSALTRLPFAVQVDGMEESPTVRLVLRGGPVTIVLDAEKTEDGSYVVEVPPLSKVLSEIPRSFDSVLEVVGQSQYFTPWKGTIGVKVSPVVKALPMEARGRRATASEKKVTEASPEFEVDETDDSWMLEDPAWVESQVRRLSPVLDEDSSGTAEGGVPVVSEGIDSLLQDAAFSRGTSQKNLGRAGLDFMKFAKLSLSR